MLTFEQAQKIAARYGFTLRIVYGENVDGTPYENWYTETGAALHPDQTAKQAHATMRGSVQFVKQFGHGGKRAGAGRKPALKRLNKILIFVTDEQLSWLDKQPRNRSETIRLFIQSKLSPARGAGSKESANETATDVERSD